jgi:hypothetical protein
MSFNTGSFVMTSSEMQKLRSQTTRIYTHLTSEIDQRQDHHGQGYGWTKGSWANHMRYRGYLNKPHGLVQQLIDAKKLLNINPTVTDPAEMRYAWNGKRDYCSRTIAH